MIRNAQTTAKQLCQLIKDGHNLVVAHGNGPQVGAIFLQNQVAVAQVPEMPLNVCGAESQGQIGYIVQQALQNQLRDDGIDKCVATVVTQVEVDPNDDAFKNPSKPIGKFYTKEEAEQLRKEGKFVIEDSGRGYRVAVASPRPLRIVEAPMIIDLVNKGHIVISGGGGGIPVMRDEKGHLRGVEAVIDKDRLSSILGVTVEADIFIIITDVDYVAINFNKPNQQFLKTITLSEAKKYMEEGHFGMGSMQPKIEAAISFVEKTGKEALICSMDKVCEAVEGKAGTRIVPDP
jgi:carbamate kinase